MKKLSLLFVAILVFPSVAFASWWNPFSWSIFNFSQKKDDNTRVLENRIKELEDKINSQSGTTTKEIKITSPTRLQDKGEQVEQVSKPVITVNTQISTPSKYSQSDFLALETKYTNFQNKINNEIIDTNSGFSGVKRMHQTFLTNLLEQVNTDLSEIDKLNQLNPMPAGPIEKYNAEFINISNIYDAEISKVARNLVIEYFVDNKNSLYLSQIHINSANLLDRFDQLYGTNYAKEFKLAKTQQETIEFADSFLLSEKYRN